MINLALAALFLPLTHFLLSSGPLRPRLVQNLGERGFTLGYSLLTVVAFVWLVLAYRGAPTIVLWTLPPWAMLVLLPVMFAAGVLAVAGLATPNPAMVRSEGLLEQPNIVRGVLRITRNPFFWGAGIVALGHALIAGHAAALLAYGSVAFLGFAGASILDAKKARRHGTGWKEFAAATSNLPFRAIAEGRQNLAWRELASWQAALALGLTAATLLLHGTLFGSDPLSALRALM